MAIIFIREVFYEKRKALKYYIVCEMLKFLLSLLGLGYLVCPYDLVPDFLIGPGWIDDAILLVILWWYFFSYQKGRSRFRNVKTETQTSGKKNRWSGDSDEGPTSDNKDHYSNGTDIRDPYTVLGIDRSASHDEIKAAYRRLAGQYHPDKVTHLGDEFRELAEKRFKEIQEAFRKLS